MTSAEKKTGKEAVLARIDVLLAHADALKGSVESDEEEDEESEN